MTSMHTTIYDLAYQAGQRLLKNKLHCTVAESCTGGSLAAAMTDIAGSSQWFDCGFVTYSNASKQQLLHVPENLLLTAGAVSEDVVRVMAEGALAVSKADISIAISGIAGPGGGSAEKPVGTVWIAWADVAQATDARCYVFPGDRAAIRQQAVHMALAVLVKQLECYA